MSKVTRILYPVFEVKNIEKWHSFTDALYGLPIQKNDASGEHEIVIDEDGCRIILREGKANDIIAAGWETNNLDGLFDKLSKVGANPQWMDKEAAKNRGCPRAFRVTDPAGLSLEIFERTLSANSFIPSRHGLEFETGAMGFGHITLITAAYDALEKFYCQQLGMGVSDYIDWEIIKGMPLHLGFFHANSRHHSLAAGRMKGLPKLLHHFMLEVKDKNQVGTSFERICAAKLRIANTIGMHPNDKSFSFYLKTPSGFEAELGAEGQSIDMTDRNRNIPTYHQLSTWGHKMSTKDALPLRIFAMVKKWTGDAA